MENLNYGVVSFWKQDDLMVNFGAYFIARYLLGLLYRVVGKR